MRWLTRIAFSLALPAAGVMPSFAAELVVRLQNAPERGRLVFQVYDSANAFGDFRDPARELTREARGDGEYALEDLPAGDVALLVYLDANDNGLLDRNFIGIPTEQLGLSNAYRPQGPPSFERARFRLDETGTQTIDVELYRPLGERGRIGVGLGVIGRSSPYERSTEQVLQVIPAITYSGKRLQWLGPSLRYGLVGSGRLRLALTASYRIGSYEETDSPALAGLGDRESTLLAGLGLGADLPGGVELGVGYEHDVLDRIGGGAGRIEVSKGFQLGRIRLQPQLAINWLSGELGDHDFGVPATAAAPGRPPYRLGDTWSYELALGGFVELRRSWLLFVNVAVETLDDDVSSSPIIADDTIVKGFTALVITF